MDEFCFIILETSFYKHLKYQASEETIVHQY